LASEIFGRCRSTGADAFWFKKDAVRVWIKPFSFLSLPPHAKQASRTAFWFSGNCFTHNAVTSRVSAFLSDLVFVTGFTYHSRTKRGLSRQVFVVVDANRVDFTEGFGREKSWFTQRRWICGCEKCRRIEIVSTEI